jgi:hypothetical protein
MTGQPGRERHAMALNDGRMAGLKTGPYSVPCEAELGVR